MPEQSHPTGAVFISYCSQDAPAAERICEALRAVGVDVWLDKNELRGGDTWDAQIKKRIHECALFIPLVSAHTNARSEGYFRREWKLATRRLLDMADDVSFLVPVVIDGTREADARVPEEFLRAQWTWLRNGETPPAFAQRVRQLLGSDSATVRHAQSAATRVHEPNAPQEHSTRPWFWFAGGRGTHRVRGVGLALIALLLVLGAGAFWYFQGASDAPTAKPALPVASPLVAAAPYERSIAVLPFADMSEERDHEYFADGMAEEVLDLLSKIPGVRTIGRSSSFQFKGKSEDLRTIGTILGVAYVVEGSVRKSGNRLRVTAQLIGAQNGSELWSDSYDAELGDVLKVQDQIAAGIGRALQVTVGADDLQSRALLSTEAYDLYLRGRHEMDRFNKAGFESASGYFQHALELDPSAIRAAEWLAAAHEFTAEWGFVPVRGGFELARASVDRALALDPRSGMAHSLKCTIQIIYDWDWVAAAEECDLAMALEPRNPQVLGYAGQLQVAVGNWNEAARLFNAALEHDPLFAGWHYELGIVGDRTGHRAEAEAEYRRTLEISPTYVRAHFYLGSTLLAQGELDAALAEMRRETADGGRDAGLAIVYHAMGRKSESDAALRQFTKEHVNDMAYWVAEVHAYRGELDQAFVWLDRAYRQKDVDLWYFKGDPLLKNLQADPRYKAFLRKMKLPE